MKSLKEKPFIWPDSFVLVRTTCLPRIFVLTAGFCLLTWPGVPALAQGRKIPNLLALQKGLKLRADLAIVPSNGGIFLWVKSDHWDDAKANSTIIEVTGPGKSLKLSLQGLSIEEGKVLHELRFPSGRRTGQHLLGLRWDTSSMELWLDARKVETKEEGLMSGLTGILTIVDPGDSGVFSPLGGTLSRVKVQPGSIAKLVHEYGLSNCPLIEIPKIQKPPIIDGHISGDEWAEAASVSSFHEYASQYLSEARQEVLASYNSQYLYVAYRGKAPEAVEQRRNPAGLARILYEYHREPDAALEEDDCLEIVLTPEYPFGATYHLLTNHRGTHLDYQTRNGVQRDRSWNPEWQTGTSVRAGEWIVEAGIPLAACGAVGKLEGKVWGVNFRRLWRFLLHQTDEWATGLRLPGADQTFWVGSPPSTGTVGRLRFGSESGLVTRMLSADGFRAGAPVLKFEILNRSGEPKKLELETTTNSGEFTRKESLKLSPNSRTVKSIEGRINLKNTYTFTFEVLDSAGAGVQHRSTYFFQQRKKPTSLLRYYPSFDRLDIDWDFSALEEHALDGLAVEVHFIDRSTNKIVSSQGFQKFKSYYPHVRINTSRLAPGRYVLAALIGARRKEVGRIISLFEKKDSPAWRNNAEGLQDEVPPPFEPVMISGTRGVAARKVRVVGRTYDFGRSCLPVQIFIGDSPILAGPMSLQAKRPGKIVRDMANSFVWGAHAGNPVEFKFYNRKSWRVEWESTSNIGEVLRPAINGSAEFDGLLWFKVNVQSRNWPALSLLRLRIPLKKEWASLINNCRGDLRGTGRLGSTGLKKRISPVWLGNEKGGLQWLMGTDLAMRLEEPETAVEVIPREKDVLLQVTFVDHEIRIPAGFQVEFGLIATPVRPAAPWHLLKGTMTGRDWQAGQYQPKSTDWGNPLAWPTFAYGTKEKPEDQSRGSGEAPDVEIAPYLMPYYCRAGNSAVGQKMRPLLDYYFYEWAASSSLRKQTPLSDLVVSPGSRSWQDFVVWTYEKMIERKPYTGLLVDLGKLRQADNQDGGAGRVYRGESYPEWTLQGLRQMLKRVYVMLRYRQPLGSIRTVVPGELLAPLLSFSEMAIQGQNLKNLLTLEHPHTYEHLSLDAFRAQYLGTNFGPPTWWWPQRVLAFKAEVQGGKAPGEIFDDPDREARWCAGIGLLHNCAIKPGYLPGKWPKIKATIRQYDLNSRDYEFMGYWEQKAVQIEPARENIVASVFLSRASEEDGRGQKCALIVLFNNTDREVSLKLMIDWKSLKLPVSQFTLSLLTDNSQLSEEKGAYRVEVPRRDVCLLGIQPKKVP